LDNLEDEVTDLRRKVHDCLEEVISNRASMNVMRGQMADIELAHGALRAKVNGLAPMVIDLTDDEVEVRVEEEEIVIPGLEPIVPPLEWNGEGRLVPIEDEAGVEGTDSASESEFEFRDFAAEEREQAILDGPNSFFAVCAQALADPSPLYEDAPDDFHTPPPYEADSQF
jgi:hypothetical protein